MRGFPYTGNAARLVLASLIMGLLLPAEGTIFAQDTITTFASSGANAKFDGIGVAVNAKGDVYATGSTPVPITPGSTEWFPAVLKPNVSGNIMIDGSQSNPSPPYGTGVCGQPATDIDPTDMGGVAADNSGTFYSAMAGGYPPVLRISGGTVSCLGWGPSGPQAAQDVALDSSGNVYFISEDSAGNRLVYKSTGTGTPTVIAETSNLGCSTSYPFGLTVDNRTVDLYIADAGCNVIWQVPAGNPAGITRYAGNFVANADPTSSAGDGKPATSASLDEPHGVALDAYGNLYIADFGDNRIRKVDSTGIITTIAGTGAPGYTDNGDATKGELKGPWGIAVGPGGKIYVGDSANGAIRLITPVGAEMISPPPGSTVPEAVTFVWSAISGATSYQIDVSHNINAMGQGDIVGSATGIITGTSLRTDIPCDGKTIYVQLSTEISSGDWTAPVMYTYTASQLTLSIGVNPSTLPKQGGAVTVDVAVDTLPLAPSDAVELRVTQYRVPIFPCVGAGCPVPKVLGTESLSQDPVPLSLSFEANVPSFPFPYQQPYIFSATLNSSTGEVLATASVDLIQY